MKSESLNANNKDRDLLLNEPSVDLLSAEDLTVHIKKEKGACRAFFFLKQEDHRS